MQHSPPELSLARKRTVHDINNQLTIMITNVQLALREPDLTPDMEGMLTDSLFAAKRAIQSVRALCETGRSRSATRTPHVIRIKI